MVEQLKAARNSGKTPILPEEFLDKVADEGQEEALPRKTEIEGDKRNEDANDICRV